MLLHYCFARVSLDTLVGLVVLPNLGTPILLVCSPHGNLVLPSCLSIFGLFRRFLFCPTHSCGVLKDVVTTLIRVTILGADIKDVNLSPFLPLLPGLHSSLDSSSAQPSSHEMPSLEAVFS